MKEDHGRILEALDHLDPALIEDMDGQATAKRRSTPVRVLLIAACICTLLVMGVVAAEISGVDIVSPIKTALGLRVSDIHTIEEKETEMTGWTVNWKNTDPACFSEAFLADLRASTPDHNKNLYKCFESQEELENYVGITLFLNPLLEAGDMGDWQLSANSAGKVIYVYLNGQFCVEGSSGMGGNSVNIALSARASTADQPGIGSFYSNVKESTQEKYVTPNGLPITISRLYIEPEEQDDSEETYCMMVADFSLGRLSYELTANVSATEEIQTYEVLKQVLDAYE